MLANGQGAGVLVLVVPVLLFGGALALGIVLHRRRVEALRRWATATGWTYVGSDASLVRRWRGQPFGQGHAQRTSDVLVGTFEGARALSFAYAWTTGSGKNQTTHTAHVVALGLPATLPWVEVTPQGLGARLAKVFGAQDIDFELQEFNDAFRVASGDARVAHAIIHPRHMEALLAGPRLPWRIEGADVLTWRLGGTDLATIHPALVALRDVRDAVPRHVWQDHGWDPVAG